MNRKSGLATFVLALVLGAGVVWGSVMGSISGTVTDPSGALIPGVAVVALNTETGIKTSTQTNQAGFYSFPALTPGHYEVVITNKGFQEYRQTGLVLDVNTAMRVDATLKVGAITQEVSVSATAVQVETSNTQMGEVITSNQMTAMPLNGRSYVDLLALQPGVVPQSSGSVGGYWGGNAVAGTLNAGNLSVSGGKESSNGFMVNGGNTQENLQMGTTIIPNLDSIAEFRVITGEANAEYGNYSGGLVNTITKSGTNQFHGDAFDFIRNPSLDARNFYSPTRAVLHQNQFGGTFGGPIVRNKVFFFSDYQGTRMVQGVDTGIVPVPSAADRSGNLSDQAAALVAANLGVNGANWANVLSQELGYPVTAGEPYFTYTPPGGQPSLCTSLAQGCVFPNAIIPQSLFTAPTNALMKYIPLPNLGSNDFTSSANRETQRDDKASYRLDTNTRLGMLAGYYFIDDYALLQPVAIPGFATTNNGRNMMANVGLTKSFGSSVNELRLHYMRHVTFPSTPAPGTPIESLADQGFTGVAALVPQQNQTIMQMLFNNYSFGYGASSGLHFYENTDQVLDNFSKVMGTHTLKFGGSFHYDQTTNNWHMINGNFTFNGTETGYDFADFLIGAPSGYSQGQATPLYMRARYYDLYAQDSWRATKNLTVNYGLRWEVSTPWWEAHNEFEAMVPGEQSRVFPGAPTGWVFPGDPGIPSTQAPTRYNNFGPRLGLAYSPSASGGLLGKLTGGPGNTSIRTSFGVYYAAFEGATVMNEVADAPYGFWWSSTTPPQFANPFIDRYTGHNEGQRFPAPFPPLNAGPNNPDNSINWALFEPISGSPGFNITNRLPYTEEFNVSVQRQFGSATLLSVSYVESQSHRLLTDFDPSPGDPALCLSVSQPSEVLPGTPTCGPFGENTVYYPVSGGVINGTHPRMGIAFGGDYLNDTLGNSTYNALEVTLRHTVGRWAFLAGYTFSKSLDNSTEAWTLVNPINTKISKSLSTYDLPHNFVMSYSYRLPFDKLGGPNRLTSGWTISGVTRFATGLPVNLSEPDDRSLLGQLNTGVYGTVDEPNYTPGPLQIANPRNEDLATLTNPYFNKSLFSREALGTTGTANRQFFTGPGTNNWDMALRKEVKLTESKSLEFRGEFFNVFNHAHFGNPNGCVICSTFGFVTNASGQRIGQVAAKLYF